MDQEQSTKTKPHRIQIQPPEQQHLESSKQRVYPGDMQGFEGMRHEAVIEPQSPSQPLHPLPTMPESDHGIREETPASLPGRFCVKPRSIIIDPSRIKHPLQHTTRMDGGGTLDGLLGGLSHSEQLALLRATVLSLGGRPRDPAEAHGSGTAKLDHAAATPRASMVASRAGLLRQAEAAGARRHEAMRRADLAAERVRLLADKLREAEAEQKQHAEALAQIDLGAALLPKAAAMIERQIADMEAEIARAEDREAMVAARAKPAAATRSHMDLDRIPAAAEEHAGDKSLPNGVRAAGGPSAGPSTDSTPFAVDMSVDVSASMFSGDLSEMVDYGGDSDADDLVLAEPPLPNQRQADSRIDTQYRFDPQPRFDPPRDQMRFEPPRVDPPRFESMAHPEPPRIDQRMVWPSAVRDDGRVLDSGMVDARGMRIAVSPDRTRHMREPQLVDMAMRVRREPSLQSPLQPAPVPPPPQEMRIPIDMRMGPADRRPHLERGDTGRGDDRHAVERDSGRSRLGGRYPDDRRDDDRRADDRRGDDRRGDVRRDDDRHYGADDRERDVSRDSDWRRDGHRDGGRLSDTQRRGMFEERRLSRSDGPPHDAKRPRIDDHMVRTASGSRNDRGGSPPPRITPSTRLCIQWNMTKQQHTTRMDGGGTLDGLLGGLSHSEQLALLRATVLSLGGRPRDPAEAHSFGTAKLDHAAATPQADETRARRLAMDVESDISLGKVQLIERLLRNAQDELRLASHSLECINEEIGLLPEAARIIASQIDDIDTQIQELDPMGGIRRSSGGASDGGTGV
nr:hypothetical protein HK105_004529 [Polyrhizophydium stewartii]